MELFIGVDKNKELVSLEWDAEENRQKNHFSLCGSSYNNPKTEEEGESEARELLESGDYWDGIYNLNNMPTILLNQIDYSKVAEEVLSVDGWLNINGEYQEFGEFEGDTIFLSCGSGGQHKVDIKDFDTLFVEDADLRKVYRLWDTRHLKELRTEDIRFMEDFFEKYKNLCDRREALNKSYELLKD